MGRATHLASNDAHQVIARAVPLSFIRIINFWKLVGVPERFVVIDVIAVARAVIECASELSVLIVGVADEVSEVTRGVIRLLVKVCVEDMVGTCTHSTAINPAETRVMLVSLACPNSIAVNIGESVIARPKAIRTSEAERF